MVEVSISKAFWLSPKVRSIAWLIRTHSNTIYGNGRATRVNMSQLAPDFVVLYLIISIHALTADYAIAKYKDKQCQLGLKTQTSHNIGKMC